MVLNKFFLSIVTIVKDGGNVLEGSELRLMPRVRLWRAKCHSNFLSASNSVDLCNVLLDVAKRYLLSSEDNQGRKAF